VYLVKQLLLGFLVAAIVRTYIFTILYFNKLTVYILIEVITLDPGHYFLKHWMRVLPIENSARGGFIPIY
jgi:hypothetical protein